jgi:hypothetical protein
VVDLLLQVDELATLWVKAWIARAHTPHALRHLAMTRSTRRTSGAVGVTPQLPALLDPQQPGIGELVVLESLVLWRQVGIARASSLDAVLDGFYCAQQPHAGARHGNGQDD